MTEQQDGFGCISDATLAGIQIEKIPFEDEAQVDMPPPGTSVVSFIAKLFELVNNKDTQKYICWSEQFKRRAIFIPDPVEFSKQILPQFFKHSNICSFVRQLNIYGFKKLETPTGFCFRHDSFIADHPELLPNIQRKKPTPHRKKTGGDDTTSLYQYLLAQLVGLQKQNTETQTQIGTLKELLYQLKLREDTLEVKLYRMAETIMPSMNSYSMMFNQANFLSMMSQQNNTQTQQTNDQNNPFLMPFAVGMTQANSQQNAQTTMQQAQQSQMSQWGQQKSNEDTAPQQQQQQDNNGFVQWDFQNAIPWKF
ncbi:heat stress transcription factor A-4C, putative [Entamoeba invadens IP1]|uniref:Heat stress transcription factor A-4C, putative n=1 Tax=Entamoeba invadens IP1 TaxID=370355 RepID=L7FJQ6_ENTIV|nr:heat stress transcription factor A-4C, putative [Entamoeba invadens IP1]ELP84800.1 heat stress transcription factor A-4C, putative [Entamoeba invadens IP1]|eukprot:XP_004184146.1 heat stress transcription factor A-4C, putative [Entamoeba invadens IP1]